MGRTTPHSMSLDRAKQRLRSTAHVQDVSGQALRRQPYQALLISFMAGLVVGGSPQSRDRVMKTLLRFVG